MISLWLRSPGKPTTVARSTIPSCAHYRLLWSWAQTLSCYQPWLFPKQEKQQQCAFSVNLKPIRCWGGSINKLEARDHWARSSLVPDFFLMSISHSPFSKAQFSQWRTALNKSFSLPGLQHLICKMRASYVGSQLEHRVSPPLAKVRPGGSYTEGSKGRKMSG